MQHFNGNVIHLTKLDMLIFSVLTGLLILQEPDMHFVTLGFKNHWSFVI